jgi:transcriptional regulator with XRE-family HTH domain
MIEKEVKNLARQKIGEFLKSVRKEKNISTYQMTNSHGIRFEVIQAIERGGANYTIDNFLVYIEAIDCYFYLANRDGKTHDIYDMIIKAEEDRRK